MSEAGGQGAVCAGGEQYLLTPWRPAALEASGVKFGIRVGWNTKRSCLSAQELKCLQQIAFKSLLSQAN